MFDERDAAEDVGGQALLSVLLLQGLLPEGGGELEDAALGPGRQEAQQVADIGPGLDAVELAARQEGDKDRVGMGALVAAQEEPVLAAEHLAAQVLLGDVVVERQAAVVEESAQRGALVAGVAEGLRDRRLVEGRGGLLLAPVEEGVGDGPRLLATDLLALLAAACSAGSTHSCPTTAPSHPLLRLSRLVRVGVRELQRKSTVHRTPAPLGSTPARFARRPHHSSRHLRGSGSPSEVFMSRRSLPNGYRPPTTRRDPSSPRTNSRASASAATAPTSGRGDSDDAKSDISQTHRCFIWREKR